MNVDVGIVGGGVAGSALGHILARAGVRVALVERESAFRDRIRGEAIHPWGTREVDRLGLRRFILDKAAGLELPVWQTYRGRIRQDPFTWTDLGPDTPPVLSVRHPDLQSALLAAAGDSGVTVFRPATVELDRSADGPMMRVRHDDRQTDIHARLIVGADGTHSATRKWLGGTARRDPVHHYLAGALLRDVNLPENAAHHASGPGGFMMVFPQTNDSFRLYLVCLPEQRDSMKGCPQPEAIVAAASRFLPEGTVGHWASIGPAGFFANADVVSTVGYGPATVLIGDAAGTNDPSLGHGLGLSFRDVRGLSGLLLGDARWEEIPALFADQRQRYYGVLREHAKWSARITTEAGPEADALRERVARAREIDPTAGGFAGIFAYGPDGLVADESARRHFLGEDIGH